MSSDDEPVIGFWSSAVWLIVMTAIIALLSEYVVGTIEVIKTFFMFDLHILTNLNMIMIFYIDIFFGD